MKKGIRFALILALAGLLTGCDSQRDRVAAVYESSYKGQSEREIIAAVGEPDETGPCGDHLSWNGDTVPNLGQCVKWARHNFFLTAYAFGYSRDGSLVSRYLYTSE